MSENPTPLQLTVPQAEAKALFDAAKLLARKLIDVEQDPDLLSVFGIARAHGYKATSKFWHVEHQELIKTVVAYEKAYNEANKQDGSKPADAALEAASAQPES